MPEINQLTAVDEVFAGDAIPLYSAANGDARKASLAVIRDFIQDNLDLNVDLTHQYAAPSATGFTVTLTDNGESKWLILTPDADYAAGTIVFPSVANAVDDQDILITTTKAVNTLTLNGNGSTVVGGPTNLNANTSVRFRYDTVLDRWYAVGTDVNEVANSLKSSATTGVMKIAGPAAGSTRTMTIPDANATVLTTNALVTVGQGGTGVNTLTVNGVVLGNGSGALQTVAPGSNGAVLQSNGTAWLAGPIIASGEWTPTATAVANLDSITVGKCRYHRIGSIVFVSGTVVIDTTANDSTQFRLTLPIASNFANSQDASGTVSFENANIYGLMQVSGDTTNDALYFNGYAEIGVASIMFSGAYTII